MDLREIDVEGVNLDLVMLRNKYYLFHVGNFAAYTLIEVVVADSFVNFVADSWV